ncbi:hypothetical protein MELA_02679 [Candidatus Methylomirabilis lanthanidiphila]|uniref:Uncharacterized protein n=1 Tax=Candidatus Methylomirabilis lanthanidiphila TaxID=2211376 RepID=A0A564ZLS4_9BACT|nr:hypothetical protein MELA_02679 [Candidatus Methylomirabilis lanthanidiphila]
MRRARKAAEIRETKKALFEQMDRLSEKIGPIRVRAATLIREGRRR